ncbi:hypothetical protein LMG3458_02511 [Achromobacter deleyi]|uniref:HTH cro/C1-type domain-containing protein n=1 Tax=Achromobacter deleyi TaxID=1353891 RepID=A0A6S6ZUY2_9BURK|nr:helix-turn-helix transcriptional regulator [Achromobacter deleyi]CAB3698323.1 hypothetical protein LMG3458_02511 [Achromobacter deleyi]CAB3852812.1 hypothetical protein LMG3481_01853 [Achromobacter deleyi]CAB3875631.1 hypothetical protein LMG3482_03021 [Achromobacter deleyi]
MNMPLLSDVAEESLFRQADLRHKLPPPSVLLLMRQHGWSALRAWREAHKLSRVEVANRLDLTLITYSLIENGMVPLCEWTAPFLETRLDIEWSIVWHAPVYRPDPVQDLPKRRGRARREPRHTREHAQ